MRTELTFPMGEVQSGGVRYAAYQMPYQNLYDTLADTSRRFPDKTGLIDASREITFRALRRETDELAAYLSGRLHLGIGSRVALMMVNSIEFCVAFYAVLKLGATVVSVNTKLSADEVRFVLEDSGAVCLVMDTMWYGKVERVLPYTSVKNVLYTGEGGCAGCSLRAARKEGQKLPASPTARDDTLPAEIMYTSGTTGKPKGAVMTHFNLLQAMYAYAAADDMDETESTVLAVPVFHITGLNCVLTLFVFLGGLIVMTPFFDASDVLDKMCRYRITHFHAVATVFILLESAIKPWHDLSCLRTALCGGGFVTEETIRRFCAKAPNCRFHPVYGMTETSGAGTYFPEHCLDSAIRNSCGKVEPNCEIRVVDAENREVACGTEGEICFRGAFVIHRYLHEADRGIDPDGWLHSGDLGCFDAEGYLYIKDRMKDMINRGGEKVYSLSVEAAIMKFGRIKQAAVFAVDDSLYGEVPGAAIIPEPGESIDLDELVRYLREHLAHYKVPVYIELRDRLPVTANSKVKKYQLRKEFNEKYAHRV